MADDVRTQRSLFMVEHQFDVLGRAGGNDPRASGVAFDLLMSSGNTPYIDRVDIRNIAITSEKPNTYRLNFFHSASRGGTVWTDSTYIGGLDIPTASGMPHHYSSIGSGVYYGNAHNSTYGQGVSCYLPYFDYDHATHRSVKDDTQYIHGTIQNLGNYLVSGVKVITLYELASPRVYT